MPIQPRKSLEEIEINKPKVTTHRFYEQPFSEIAGQKDEKSAKINQKGSALKKGKG
jgi:hypothetical protein